MDTETILLLAAAVLIVLLIIEKIRAERVSAFLLKLLRENRITRGEYDSAFHGKNVTGANPPQAQNVVQMPQVNGQMPPVTPPVNNGVQYNAPTGVPQGNMQRQIPFTPQSAPVIAKEKKKVNSGAVLLLIGVAFVILAGIIFSTAAWHSMSDIQRVGLVTAVSAFFFAVSEISRRKLKLISTGMAFYMLGGVFIGISFLSVGYFGLMGDWLSTHGGGRYLLYALFMLIVTAVSAGASFIYKNTVMKHASLYGAAISFALVSMQVTDSLSAWSLSLNAVSALLLFIAYRSNGKDSVFRSFSYVITGIFAFTALPQMLEDIFGRWDIFTTLTMLIWTVQLIFYAIKLDHHILRAVYPSAVVILITELAAGLWRFDIKPEISYVIAAAAMLIAFTVCRMVSKLSSETADAIYISSIFITALLCTSYGAVSAVIFLSAFAASAAAAQGLGGTSEKEQKVLRIFSVIPALITAAIAGDKLGQKIGELIGAAGYVDLRYRFITYAHPVRIFSIAVVILLTAFFYRYSEKIGLKLRSQVSDLLIGGVSVVYVGCISPYMLGLSGYIGEPTVYSASAAAVLALLVAAYVFEKRPPYRTVTYIMRRVFPLAAVYFIFRLSVCGEEILYRSFSADEDMQLIVRAAAFIVLSAAVTVCFVNIRKIRTAFSDIALPFCIAIECIELSQAGFGTSSELAAAAAWAALTVLLFYEGMDIESGGHLIVIRVAPLFSMFALSELADSIVSREFSADGLFGREIVITFALIVTAVFFAKAKAMTPANAQSLSDRKLFLQMQYIWSCIGGMLLFTGRGETAAASIVLVILCAAFYLLAEFFGNDLPAMLPLLMMFNATVGILCELKDYGDIQDGRFVISLILFLLFAVCSRIFHRERFFDNKAAGRLRLDLPAFAMLIAAAMTAASGGGSISRKGAVFVAVIELSVFCLNLIRSRTSESFNKKMYTLSSGLLCTLIWLQPFGEIESDFIRWKLNILPIVIFGVIFRLIWKNATKGLSDAVFGIYLAAYAALLLNALADQTAANTAFVLAAAFIIMIVSYAVKNRRWFTVSSASLLGLTLYITRDFLAAVQWWVYLLGVGIILIVIAAVNEYFKTRGESFKEKLIKSKTKWK